MISKGLLRNLERRADADSAAICAVPTINLYDVGYADRRRTD